LDGVLEAETQTIFSCGHKQGRSIRMLTLTSKAIEKVKEFTAATPKVIINEKEDDFAGLRVGVQGGGCSGFSYTLSVVPATQVDPEWNVIEQDGIKVFVDQMSAMYLDEVTVDYVEQIDGSGFKFINPMVKSTCGCGSSFSV
jgi:iron-sulfur cluster assembly accessory protein